MLNKSFTNAIICGATQSSVCNITIYIGIRENPDRFVIPNGSLQEYNYCNGSFVLIPRKVFHVVGNLDPIFHHAVGDFDYSLRAKKMGIKLFVASDFVG